MKNLIALFIFLAAAVLEVGGDALIRKGMRGMGIGFIVAGLAAISSYGIVVNTVKMDFSKMLGVYISVFVIVTALFGRFIFKETIPGARLIGIAMIVIGGLVIQFWAK
ncbi:MAG TPA: hypothetical protein VLX91_11210 [Candidatus Acidoferrales bacterium]|nr:hypothetical protein [Candidatus Acidoferrales bacterium]